MRRRPHYPTPVVRRHRSAASTAVTVLVSALAAGACAEAPPPPPFPSQAHREAAVRIGSVTADAVMGTLLDHLTAALDSAGPVGAIDFCAREALALTGGAEAGVEGVEIKRTSTRVRNPANAPDSLEALALAYFESRLDASTGRLPDHWLQVDGDVALRYYRPLVANQLCVQCHGPLAAIAPAVLAKLDQRYPADQATGYLAGDFRGVIRVRVTRPALETSP